MPSTFTQNTGIELIADGEQTGLWGQTTNNNFDIVDRAVNGVGFITLSSTSLTLTTSSGVLSDGQFAVLVFSGAPGGTATVTIAPDTAQKLYWVRNATSQNVILTQGSGANVTVPSGTNKAVFSDGAGATAAVFDITNTLSGNTSTATALQTARTIGGVSFNGTANIDLPGVNQAGNQNTTGSAAALTTARSFTIGSTARNFNGGADVSWSLADIGAASRTLTLTAGTGLTGGGDLTESRTFELASNERMTTNNVLEQTAAASFGAVGTYALLRAFFQNGPFTPGVTTSGTFLSAATANGTPRNSGVSSITAVSGTWRCMGITSQEGEFTIDPRPEQTTLFLRIA
jgi:hypothetical protein